MTDNDITLRDTGAFDQLLQQLDKARWYDLHSELDAAQARNSRLAKSMRGVAATAGMQRSQKKLQAEQLVKALDHAADLCERGQLPPQQLVRLEVLVNHQLARLP